MTEIQLKGFQVYVVGADPWSACRQRIPINLDVVNTTGLLNSLKRLLIEKDKEWFRRARDNELPFKVRVGQVVSVAEYARIHHKGVGRSANISMEFITAPSVVFVGANRLKYDIYHWLRKNAAIVPMRPEKIYIVPETRISELGEVIRKSRELTNTVNDLLEEYWASVEREILNILHKFNVPAASLKKPYIHPPYVTITPIQIGTITLETWRERDPEVARMLELTIHDYARKIAEDFRDRLKPVVEAILEHQRKVRVSTIMSKISEIRKLARELGLEAIAQVVTEDLELATRDPVAFHRKYSDVQAWIDAVDSRIETLL